MKQQKATEKGVGGLDGKGEFYLKIKGGEVIDVDMENKSVTSAEMQAVYNDAARRVDAMTVEERATSSLASWKEGLDGEYGKARQAVLNKGVENEEDAELATANILLRFQNDSMDNSGAGVAAILTTAAGVQAPVRRKLPHQMSKRLRAF